MRVVRSANKNLIAVLCALAVSIFTLSAGQEKPAKKTTARSNSTSGPELYKRYCAVCHGNDLKGNGPAPPPFQDRPPDLTTLARRNNGQFPDAYVAKVLRSGLAMPAHGPAEMPIWETAFKEMGEADDAQVALRIKNLTNYIKSLQAK